MLIKDINMETETGDQASNLRMLVDKLNNNNEKITAPILALRIRNKADNIRQ